MLEQHAGGQPLITEVKALGPEYGPFDLALLVRAEGGEVRKVYFDVDGETHDEQYQDTTAGQQWVRDRRKDDAAWDGGLMLVRLHHSDSKFWQSTISKAFALASKQQCYRLVWYTKGHGLRGRQAPL